jgi:ribonuclease E
MLHFDKTGELKRRFLVTAVERNKNSQLRVRALQEIAALRDDEAFRTAVDVVGTWSRDERREGAKVLLQALAERRIGRRDEASQWIWDIADMTRDVHEEYAVQRWPETKRLLGLLVNSSGGAHARNARRLVHAARKQDRRLSAAILAAAVAHTPEAMEVVRGARTRMARKPSALSRELLRNFPKGRKGRNRRRRRKGDAQEAAVSEEEVVVTTPETGEDADWGEDKTSEEPAAKKPARRRTRSKPAAAKADEPASDEPKSPVLAAAEAVAAAAAADAKPKRRRPRKKPESKPEAA